MADGSEDAPGETKPAETLVAERSLERIRVDASPFASADAMRYETVGEIGRGGMGEVYLTFDRQLGRSIAMKVARSELAENGRDRFALEARLQGQLEHPSVVPVYDVGVGPAGEFFTMKRVVGVTLLDVLIGLLGGEPEIVARFSQAKLLGAFLQICQCVDYAHTRGVVHRDLKPANIMLGEFGEVYVLDWGVAVTEGSVSKGTSGTPGYMPPEQFEGRASRHADVYALGAILYEILTLKPLHAGRSVKDLVDSTLQRGEQPPPALDDLAPELARIVTRATAHHPEDRYTDARELCDALQLYLEGQRDIELRKNLADKHLARARELTECALETPDAAALRADALAEVGRALALAPDNRAARECLVRLFAEPPRQMPQEVRDELSTERTLEGRFAARFALIALVVLVLIGGVLGLMAGFRQSAFYFLAMLAPAIVAIPLVYVNSVQVRPSSPLGLAIVVLACLTIAGTSRVLGPLVLTPGLAIVAGVISMNVRNMERYRPLLLAITCATVLVPVGLELAGLIPRSYDVVNGQWRMVSRVFQVHDRGYPIGLLLSTIATLIAPIIYVWRLSKKNDELRARVQVQTWQLRQLASVDGKTL